MLLVYLGFLLYTSYILVLDPLALSNKIKLLIKISAGGNYISPLFTFLNTYKVPKSMHDFIRCALYLMGTLADGTRQDIASYLFLELFEGSHDVFWAIL